jgi:CP family cyanate transporter-like MFS transporter
VSAPTEVRRAGGSLLLVAGIGLVALNLRTAITSLGAVLPEVQDGVGMSSTVAGLVTSIGPVCFAVVGVVTPALVRRFDLRVVALLAMSALTAGLALRSVSTSSVMFLLTSVLALAGLAVGNVAMPTLVKVYFPDRVGSMTALYSTALTVGAATAAAVTVPLGAAFGGWRAGLGLWAVTAGLAVLPWLLTLRRPAPMVEAPVGVVLGVFALVRSRTAWAVTILFGMQALNAYTLLGWLAPLLRDSGWSERGAGLLLGLYSAIAIPGALVLPVLATRRPNQRAVIVVLVACYLVGYAGLAFSPGVGALVWVSMTGLGGWLFPLVLVLIPLRAQTASGASALSGFSQSLGYLLAALGPVLFGAGHEVLGSWRVPVLVLALTMIPALVAGWVCGPPGSVEADLLGQRPRGAHLPDTMSVTTR